METLVIIHSNFHFTMKESFPFANKVSLRSKLQLYSSSSTIGYAPCLTLTKTRRTILSGKEQDRITQRADIHVR